VETPCEDAADIRRIIQMKEAREAMGKILSNSKYFSKKKDEERRSILIVLDDIVDESDVDWFVFRHEGNAEVINDVLVTSCKAMEGVASVPIPPLSEEEGIELILMEANLQSNHPISKKVELREIVRR
jgi:hypothetical protein